MYRLEVLVACCLCCLLIAASTKHSDPSPVRPNIAVDEERRSLGEAKLRELERHSEGSPCWKEAVSHLDASCKDLTDLQQSRLAVAFANCHLGKSNRRTYPCTDAMTIAECTRDMDPVAFQTYTEFFTHTGHICYFLQSQLWQERTENVITRLSDSSKEALGKLEESLDYHRVLDVKQSEVLTNQDKILDQDRQIAASLQETREYMGDAFVDMREMAENQRMLLAEVFGTLQQSVESVRYLMSLFLVEFVGYETFAFFVAFWLVILFLPRFGYSRSLLHLVLFGDLAMEIIVRRIYGYFMFGNDKPPPQDLNTLHSWLWSLRYLTLLGGTVVYIWELVSYMNHERKNTMNIEKILQQMRRLMQYHGIETTEIPDDVIDPTHQRRGYGIGKSNSNELISRQSMVEQTQPSRRSLPAFGGQTGLTGSRGGGFAAVYPIQQPHQPPTTGFPPMGGAHPSYGPPPPPPPGLIGSRRTMIESDSEVEIDEREIDQVDSATLGVGGRVKRFLFRRESQSRETSQQPEFDSHTQRQRHQVSRPPSRHMTSDNVVSDYFTDTCSTLPVDSDSDADTFVPSDDPMVRQPIRIRGASSSPGSVKNRPTHVSSTVSNGDGKKKKNEKERDPLSSSRGGDRRRGRQSRLEREELSNLPTSNLPEQWGREKDVSEEKLASDSESPLKSGASRTPRTGGRGRRGRRPGSVGRPRRSDPVITSTSNNKTPPIGSEGSETTSSSVSTSRRRRTMPPPAVSTPQTRYNLRSRTPSQRTPLNQ